jgi:hypothetical protein
MKNKLVIGYSTSQPKDFRVRYNRELTESSGLEKHEISIIPYENDGSLSLTAAYNDIWECAEIFKDAVFVFIHDDIHFKTNNWGRTLLDLFNQHDMDIIGVAGTAVLHQHGAWLLDKNFEFDSESKDIWGKVWQLNQNGEEFVFDITTPAKKCKTLQPVVTIDGLFIAFNPETCSRFDEDFQSFHFYDISFCAKNFSQGRKIAVTETIQILHESNGSADELWQENRLKFCQKYMSCSMTLI